MGETSSKRTLNVNADATPTLVHRWLSPLAELATNPNPLYFFLLLACLALLRRLHARWTARPRPVPPRELAGRFARVRVLADRGAGTHGAPRNSRMAAREAAREKADGVLLDVLLSKDGVPFAGSQADLGHSNRFDRRAVGDLLSHELATLDIGQGEHPPPLSALLDVLANTPLEIHLLLPAPPKPRLSAPRAPDTTDQLIATLAELFSRPAYASHLPRLILHGRTRTHLDLLRSAFPSTRLYYHPPDLPEPSSSLPPGIAGLFLDVKHLASYTPRGYPTGVNVAIGPVNQPAYLDAAVRAEILTVGSGMPEAIRAGSAVFADVYRAQAGEAATGGTTTEGGGNGREEEEEEAANRRAEEGSGNADPEDGEDATEAPEEVVVESTTTPPRRRRRSKKKTG